MKTVKIPDLLVVDEVSEITRVPKKTIQNWASAADHGLPRRGPKHIRLSPKRRVWARDDVLSWIEEKRGQ